MLRTFLKVEPPSREYKAEATLFIDVTGVAHCSLPWADELGDDPINCEEVENRRLANAVMSDYGNNEEEANNSLHSEVAQELCGMLNFVLSKTGKEVSTDSSFSLVKSRRNLSQGRGT